MPYRFTRVVLFFVLKPIFGMPAKAWIWCLLLLIHECRTQSKVLIKQTATIRDPALCHHDTQTPHGGYAHCCVAGCIELASCGSVNAGHMMWPLSRFSVGVAAVHCALQVGVVTQMPDGTGRCYPNGEHMYIPMQFKLTVHACSTYHAAKVGKFIRHCLEKRTS